MRSEFESFRQEMRSEFEAFRVATKRDLDAIRTERARDLARLENKLTIRMYAMGCGVVGATTALVKLL